VPAANCRWHYFVDSACSISGSLRRKRLGLARFCEPGLFAENGFFASAGKAEKVAFCLGRYARCDSIQVASEKVALAEKHEVVIEFCIVQLLIVRVVCVHGST